MKQKWVKRRNSTKSDARICLWKDGVEKTFLVARLVVMAFSPVYSEELTVNHIDGNPENNNIDNLEWVTRAENNRLGYETGLFKSLQKPITLIDEFENHAEFVSQAEASRFLDRNSGYINCVLGRGGKCAVAKDGTKYRVLVT